MRGQEYESNLPLCLLGLNIKIVRAEGKEKLKCQQSLLSIGHGRHVQLHVPFPSELRTPSLAGSTEAVEEMLMTRPGSKLFESLIRRSERLNHFKRDIASISKSIRAEQV
jgi:hypothetical protein